MDMQKEWINFEFFTAPDPKNGIKLLEIYKKY